MVYISI